MSTETPPAPVGSATGPRTAEGRRIAARNATNHGLFARDVVLPRLGEDPKAYEAFLQELTRQLAPKNLLEQHYAEKIAAASWRLRRLHRWQAQLFEDAELPEDEIMLKMDRVMRHETTLHRQIDTSVKMLGRELPKLFEGRVCEDLIQRMNATERDCREDPYMDQWITAEARKRSSLPTCPPSLDLSRLDTAPVQQENCENEPAACTGMVCHAPTDDAPASKLADPEGVLMPAPPRANCQNELAPADFPNPPAAGGPCEARNEQSKAVGISTLRKARRLKRQQKCQNELSPLPPPELGAGGRSSPAPHYWGGGASPGVEADGCPASAISAA